jgi:hypothetical protein
VNVKNVALCSKMLPDSRGNVCLNTKDSDELVCPMNASAVKKYFVKMKSSISHSGLGKKERLDGLKTRKGSPCKS